MLRQRTALSRAVFCLAIDLPLERSSAVPLTRPEMPASSTSQFDLEYTLREDQFDPRADSQLLFREVDEVVLREGAIAGRRTLDVGCGPGAFAIQIGERGAEAWGIEPSQDMLGMCRLLYPPEKVALQRGVGEVLPYRDESFDRVICKGSLDHFVDAQAFMREAARILRPDGRVVIALQNFESLSCRLGRLRERMVQPFLRNREHPRRRYWEVHADHHHKGELSFVEELGGDVLQLERCYGLSLFWQFPRWGALLDRLPAPVTKGIWRTLNSAAYRMPGLADMIISVWRRPAAADAA